MLWFEPVSDPWTTAARALLHFGTVSPARATTSDHRRTFARTISAASAGPSPRGSKPTAMMRDRTSGSPRAFVTEREMYSMTPGDVFAGANRRCQFVISKLGKPDSSAVDTRGSLASRFALVTASALRAPAATCAMVGAGMTQAA